MQHNDMHLREGGKKAGKEGERFFFFGTFWAEIGDHPPRCRTPDRERKQRLKPDL